MTYRKAVEYLEEAKKYGIVPGLSTMEELCRRLGNPQDSLKFIHVAGTNGKGSVIAFLSSVLKEAGYKTGCYTSPRVFFREEQYTINGKSISKQRFSSAFEVVLKRSEEMAEEKFPHPTVFEMETALAFLVMKEAGCDVVLLETGMGGSQDATNVIKTTILSVITSISMDHTGFLGKTLPEIAEQKAGIIKDNIPVISSGQKREVLEVLQRKATACKSAFYSVEERFVQNVRYGFKNQFFDFKSPYGICSDIEINMAGTYQIQNAALAILAIQVLCEGIFQIPKVALYKGFFNAGWQGRMTVLTDKPLFVIDGAHNEAAALVLRECVKQYFTNRRIIYIMGVLRDKDYTKIAEIMAPYAEQIITVTPPNERALSALELARELKPFHNSVTAVDSLEEAVEMSFLLAGEDALILAFGSLSYLGDLKKAVEKKL